MGLETGTWVSDLTATNPPSGDPFSQGDDHLRLLKTVLRNTFPNAGKALYFHTVATKAADYTVVSADDAKFFIGNGAGAAVGFTLPTLAATLDGWEITIYASNITNAVTITPASGTINGAASLTLLLNQYARVWWDGSTWRAQLSDAINVTGLTALTTPAVDDELAIYDLSASLLKKITLTDLLEVLNVLTEDTDPAAADFLLEFDASAGTVKKVKQSKIASPVASQVVGLSIVNNTGAPNTQIDVTALEAVLTDANGRGVRHSAVAVTINSATTGANALDTGVRAANTDYYVWLISDGATVAGLISLSSTTPTMPGTYTFKKRIGWFRTDGSNNFRRILQRGNVASYTSAAVSLGSNGTLSFVGAVPSTLTKVCITLAWSNATPHTASIDGIDFSNGNHGVGAASGNFSGKDTHWISPSVLATSLAVVNTAGVSVLGWEDNI